MKYATLALLGLASAKKGMLGRPDEMDFMFKKPKCEVDESGNIYGELQYMKAFSRTIMRAINGKVSQMLRLPSSCR